MFFDTFGVDTRTWIKKLGAREKARRKKCRVRFSLIKKSKAFQKSHMKVGVKKLFRAGMVPARAWGGGGSREIKVEETDGSSSSRQQEHDFVVPIHGSIWP